MSQQRATRMGSYLWRLQQFLMLSSKFPLQGLDAIVLQCNPCFWIEITSLKPPASSEAANRPAKAFEGSLMELLGRFKGAPGAI